MMESVLCSLSKKSLCVHHDGGASPSTVFERRMGLIDFYFFLISRKST